MNCVSNGKQNSDVCMYVCMYENRSPKKETSPLPKRQEKDKDDSLYLRRKRLNKEDEGGV